MNFKLILLIALAAACTMYAAVISVYDNMVGPGDTVTMQTGNTYIMEEKIFVESTAVLNIEPGVIVKAKPFAGLSAVALVIARGGKIYAEGTADDPIIFTSFVDDLKPLGETGLSLSEAYGLWGGVIILGNAPTNWTDGFGRIEGIDLNDPRAKYGGNKADDSSGVFKYVSIRFAGVELSIDNEINGLSLGGVGSGTVLEYVEVFQNIDDAFEFFGGTVNSKYLLAVNCKDDAFDYDRGFNGRGQYWCALWGTGEAGSSRCGEHDGGDPSSAQPFAIPMIANASYIANGSIPALEMRDGAGGHYMNSIFYATDVIALENTRFNDGDLSFNNNLFWHPSGTTNWNHWNQGGPNFAAHLENSNNVIMNPKLSTGIHSNIRYYGEKKVDPRPKDYNSMANTKCVYQMDNTGFLEQACFKGAFDPTKPLWIKGWTAAEFYGLLTVDDTPPLDSIPECLSDICQPHLPIVNRFVNGDRQIGFDISRNRSFIQLQLSQFLGTYSVSIYSSNGKLAGSYQENAELKGTASIPISALQSGTYIFEIKGDDTRIATIAIPIVK
ncbi:MAG: T9SS C-terminal target domain-containing protein [Chitinivibrionales bacterium]|nr:T9SS C-terminal target domain-containing protein [Chitinivibrionales bacterium]